MTIKIMCMNESLTDNASLYRSAWHREKKDFMARYIVLVFIFIAPVIQTLSQRATCLRVVDLPNKRYDAR